MRKGQRPSRHFRKIRTRNGKKIFLINKDVSPSMTRRAYKKKRSAKQEENVNVMDMLDAAGLTDPNDRKSALASFMAEQGADIGFEGSNVKNFSKDKSSKVKPGYTSDVDIEGYSSAELDPEILDIVGRSDAETEQIINDEQAKRVNELLLANQQQEEIRAKSEEFKRKNPVDKHLDSFYDGLLDAKVKVSNEHIDDVYKNYVALRSKGFDSETAARKAGEIHKEFLEYRRTPEGMKSLISPTQFAYEKELADAKIRNKNKFYRQRELRAELMDKLRDSNLIIDNLDLDEAMHKEIKKRDKDIGVKAENRAKNLINIMRMPEDVKGDPQKESEWIKKNIIEVPKSASAGKVGRAELVSDFINDPNLAKRVADGDVPRKTLNKIEKLGLFTNNKGEVDERRLKRFAEVYASDTNRKTIARGAIPDEVKDTFRTLQVDFDVKDFYKLGGVEKDKGKALAGSLVQTNKKPPSSVKEKLSNFEAMAKRTTNPALRNELMGVVGKFKNAYSAYNTKYKEYDSFFKDAKKKQKENVEVAPSLIKDIEANKRTKKGFSDYAWLASVPKEYVPGDVGLAVPPKKLKEFKKNRAAYEAWFKKELVDSGKIVDLYNDYKNEEKINRDLNKQYAQIKNEESLTRALESKDFNTKGLNLKDKRKAAKNLGISLSRPKSEVRVTTPSTPYSEEVGRVAKTSRDATTKVNDELKTVKEREKEKEQLIKENQEQLRLVNKQIEEELRNREKRRNEVSNKKKRR